MTTEVELLFTCLLAIIFLFYVGLERLFPLKVCMKQTKKQKWHLLLLLISRSVMSDSLQPHGLHTALQAFLSFTISSSLLRLISMESLIPSNHLILCRSLLLLPSIFSSISVFSSEPVLHIRWPKCWSFSTSISPSNEYSRLISFKINWCDLLAAQGTLRSLLQHHSSKASILSYLYGPTLTSIHDYWKNHSFNYTDLCWQSDISV